MTKSKTDFFKSKPLPFPPFCTYLHAEKIPELSNHMDKRMQIKCCRNRKKKKRLSEVCSLLQQVEESQKFLHNIININSEIS